LVLFVLWWGAVAVSIVATTREEEASFVGGARARESEGEREVASRRECG
jgi:hypothetical protein